MQRDVISRALPFVTCRLRLEGITSQVLLRPLFTSPFARGNESYHRPQARGRGKVKTIRNATYKPTPDRDMPLTYEQARFPYHINVDKAFNAFNTSALHDSPLYHRKRIVIEDFFIRKFIYGVWHRLFVSQIVIKRQHNIIRIAGYVDRHPDGFVGTISHVQRIYFLKGFSEEFLSRILKCVVRFEIQTCDKRDMIFKYI